MQVKKSRFEINTGRVLLTVAILVFFPVMTLAGVTGFELSVNTSDIDGSVEHKPYEIPVTGSIGITYSNDDYLISNAGISVIDSVYIPALDLGLGFKGYLGKVGIDETDYNLKAVCFRVIGKYDFRKDNPELPIGFGSSLSVAPGVLTFNETDAYVEFNISFHLFLNDNAAIFVRHRRIDADFILNSVEKDWDESTLLVGFRLIF